MPGHNICSTILLFCHFTIAPCIQPIPHHQAALAFNRAQEKPFHHPHPIRVLIIDGFSNHNWRQTTRLIKDILEQTGRFSVTVSTTPSKPGDSAWAAWHPDFSSYAVVIQNTNNIENRALCWPRESEIALEKYTRSGGGLYILHSANNAFPHWKEYDRMIGLGWRPKETGFALKLDDRARIIRIPPGQGESTNHGDRTDAVIRILHRHPINEGFPESWKTASMEIYRYARGPAKHLTVLSYAYDSASHTNWPVEWVVRYGKGKVYNSSMGHLWKDQSFPESYKSIDFQTIVIRVTEWLATGKTTYPVPSAFPSADSVRLRDWEPK